MSNDHQISYEDQIAHKNSTEFVKWICVSIFSVLVPIFIGMATALVQNQQLKTEFANENNQLRLDFVKENHKLRIDFALLNDVVKDHLKNQKVINDHISSILADYEDDERERKRKKKTYIVNSDE